MASRMSGPRQTSAEAISRGAVISHLAVSNDQAKPFLAERKKYYASKGKLTGEGIAPCSGVAMALANRAAAL